MIFSQCATSVSQTCATKHSHLLFGWGRDLATLFLLEFLKVLDGAIQVKLATSRTFVAVCSLLIQLSQNLVVLLALVFWPFSHVRPLGWFLDPSVDPCATTTFSQLCLHIFCQLDNSCTLRCCLFVTGFYGVKLSCASVHICASRWSLQLNCCGPRDDKAQRLSAFGGAASVTGPWWERSNGC